jgi:hypothetical protein
MSIILGLIIKDLAGNKEMILASDGRAIEHGTKNIRNEDFEKVKRLTPRLCIGYCGHSGEFYEDVLIELENKIKKMMVKDLVFVSGLASDKKTTRKLRSEGWSVMRM